MFATFAGGYNRRPLPGLPDVFADAERGVRDGTLDAVGLESVADEFVREVVKEQGVVGLGIVGSGGTRWPDRLLPWIEGLDGLVSGTAGALPDGEPVTIPSATGRIRWTKPITVHDWQIGAEVSDLVVKQTILGPYSVARLMVPLGARARADRALELAEAMSRELHALAEAGCPMVEVDEPMALRIGDDVTEWRSFHAAQQRLVANVAPDGPHLSLGLWGGRIDPLGYASLIDLPYLSYLVDVLAGASAWRFIAAVPPERGIIVGSADRTTERLDEHEVHVWAMAWAAKGDRGSTRVGCAPNGSLHALSRHFAHRKCLRLAEAVNIARAGPLQDVAEALIDGPPTESTLDDLRTMARSVEEGLG